MKSAGIGARFRRRIAPDWLNRSLEWLFLVRALRSASQGYLAVIVPLYIAKLGYDAIHLGVLFTAASVASVILTALTGVLSDRFGRKTFLILISLLTVGGGIAFALSTNFTVLVLAAAIGTIGRGGGAGSGGNWGPFYPAEQALIAEHSSDRLRTSVFGTLSFVGVIAGALGSLFAWLPRLLSATAGISELAGYRVLFAFTAVFGLAMAAAVLPAHETHKFVPKNTPAAAAGVTRGTWLGLSPASWQMVWRFMVANLIQGFGIGLLGPIIVYWFYRVYGAGTGALANLFFLINLAAALPYLMAGWLAFRIGSVRAVAITRLLGAGFLIAMVAMPTFFLAALLFTLRMVTVTLAVPVAQSYLMGVIDPAERASAAGISTVPWQIGSSGGPFLAGYLMQYAAFDLPLELSAVLGAVSAVVYYLFFREFRPPEERDEPRGADAAAPTASAREAAGNRP
jgi:MFS family permease